MAGGCNHATEDPESIDRRPEDCSVTDRVRVLAWGDCARQSAPCPDLALNRTHDQWYPAHPPYHNCTEGLGPADYFGKTLLDSVREDITIGFIPCALSGQEIAVYEKGSGASIEEYTQPHRGSERLTTNAYGWMVERYRIGQQSGVIKGILFHQGETNTGNPGWVGRVKGIFDDLKQDLDLVDSLPIVVGELLQVEEACCAGHNPLVNQLAVDYPTGVASSQGLAMRPGDSWRAHFDCAGMRELGRRFAIQFLKIVDNQYLPRKESVSVNRMGAGEATLRTWSGGTRFFTVSGRYLDAFESHLPEVWRVWVGTHPKAPSPSPRPD